MRNLTAGSSTTNPVTDSQQRSAPTSVSAQNNNIEVLGTDYVPIQVHQTSSNASSTPAPTNTGNSEGNGLVVVTNPTPQNMQNQASFSATTSFPTSLSMGLPNEQNHQPQVLPLPIMSVQNSTARTDSQPGQNTYENYGQEQYQNTGWTYTQPQTQSTQHQPTVAASPAAPLVTAVPAVTDAFLSGQAGENTLNSTCITRPNHVNNISVSSNSTTGNANTSTSSLPLFTSAAQPQAHLMHINNNPTTLMSVCSPLGAELPQNVRQKIVRGEFVDFASLLELDVSGPQSAYALSVNASGQIICQDQKAKRRITSVHSWTSAFFVFSAVYLSAHPQRTQELLKYGHLIRTAASRFAGWGWRDYDSQFRLRQQLNPARSWSLIDGELWALYIAGSPRHPTSNEFFRQSKSFGGPNQNSPGANPRSSGIAEGFRPFQRGAGERLCYRFNNRDGGCQRMPCKFVHKCAKCQTPDHGARMCKQTAKPNHSFWKPR